MQIFILALIPVLAWGTWLTPSHAVRYPNQQVKTFYVTLANLCLATLVWLLQGSGAWGSLNWTDFGLVFAGGVIWAFSGLCAFTATAKIGTARAFGLWAPLNIIVSMLWGALLFGEFIQSDSTSLLLLGISLVVILAGVLMIIFAKGAGATGEGKRKDFILGLLGAIGAGVLWGSYYIPIQYAHISMWLGGFPLALGMLTGSLGLALLSRGTFRLQENPAYLRTLATGLIWGIGNYGMLLLVGALGAGRGFTISQLSVVVNALVGILVLKDPAPRTKAATLTLLGCSLATVGGIILGNLK